jgi:hypothetical protein
MAVRQIVRAMAGLVFLVGVAAAQKAEAQNWDGSGLVRFGVFLQGSSLDYKINQVTPAGAAFSQSASPSGVGVGISAGYDLRLGSFVIGAEADASFDDGGSKATPLSNEQYGIDFFTTMRGRLGYYIHPGFMFYGTAGYSLLGAEYKRGGIAITTTSSAKKYGTLGGFVYGGGVEYDLGWGIGFLEYLHSDTSGWDFVALGGGGNRITADSSQDIFRLGMKFKVGHDYAHDVYQRPDSLK